MTGEETDPTPQYPGTGPRGLTQPPSTDQPGAMRAGEEPQARILRGHLPPTKGETP